jgi:hypothetical protein
MPAGQNGYILFIPAYFQITDFQHYQSISSLVFLYFYFKNSTCIN